MKTSFRLLVLMILSFAQAHIASAEAVQPPSAIQAFLQEDLRRAESELKKVEENQTRLKTILQEAKLKNEYYYVGILADWVTFSLGTGLATHGMAGLASVPAETRSSGVILVGGTLMAFVGAWDCGRRRATFMINQETFEQATRTATFNESKREELKAYIARAQHLLASSFPALSQEDKK